MDTPFVGGETEGGVSSLMRMVAQGRRYRDIAVHLGTTEAAVKERVHRIVRTKGLMNSHTRNLHVLLCNWYWRQYGDPER